MPDPHVLGERPKRAAGSRLDGHEAEVRELLIAGTSISEISRRYAVDRSTLRHFVSTRGLRDAQPVPQRDEALPQPADQPISAMRMNRRPVPRRRVCWSRAWPVGMGTPAAGDHRPARRG